MTDENNLELSFSKSLKESDSRWFCPTPSRLLVVLLIVEGILLLSEPWFPKAWAMLICMASVIAAMALMLLWFLLALFFRWRFQFSIRSLLVLTVAVAIPCSWLAVADQQARRQRELVNALRKLGCAVYHDYQWDRFCETGFPGQDGSDYFNDIRSVNCLHHEVTNQDLESLKELNQLQVLRLAETQITDAGLEKLKGLKQLKSLNLTKTRITDAGVAKLQKALPKCIIER